MAVILLGYFSTMVTVLAALMFVLNGFLATGTFHQARSQSSHVAFAYSAMTLAKGEIAQKQQQVAALAPVSETTGRISAGAVAANSAAASVREHATAKMSAQKTRTARLARSQRRNELALARHQERTIALGYSPESRERLAAARIFGSIGLSR